MKRILNCCLLIVFACVSLLSKGQTTIWNSTSFAFTKDTASFFSYYDLTEKIAIVIGIFAFGYIEELTGNMQNSVLSLIVFFVIGFIWLLSALTKQNAMNA